MPDLIARLKRQLLLAKDHDELRDVLQLAINEIERLTPLAAYNDPTDRTE